MKDEPVFPTEVWIKVPGWEMYEVSDLGRVRSWIHSGKKLTKPKLKRPQKNKNGYLYVQFQVRPRVKRYSIHRLVMETFNPIADDWEMDVAHIDGVKSNNRLDNLKWANRAENEQDKKRHGTYLLSRQRILCKKTEDAIPKLHFKYRIPRTELGRIFGVSASTISNILKRNALIKELEKDG